jgi:DNA-binding response OmpR family regulator
MYNILIISKDDQPFKDLINLLRRDFLNVYLYPSIEMANGNDDLRQYDFILLHVESDHDVKTITEIKNHCICPLYIFSDDHNPSAIAHFLESGSEGHVEIPFKPEVVAPRIKAVLRFLHQIKRGVPNTLRYGRLTLHLDNREVLIDGNKVPLTNVEFKIVQILVEHRETVVSKDKIIHHVWNEDTSATDNALGIHITRLRKKLTCKPDEELIETVWGLGYRLNLEQCEK